MTYYPFSLALQQVLWSSGLCTSGLKHSVVAFYVNTKCVIQNY